ncbi:hypothetical protein F4561_001721 [Lipingzhangella halophila]|uniref:Acyl dehydratase n=1 Tax=Lipingzhangella halophila TaxID=1783352 RepID=A0A7W7W1Q2_9ACTN|nr:hypothetical protein [Lipingzhangella halophila]MBB4930901.1 hypothetical protein [Lipingzhangella halophila]
MLEIDYDDLNAGDVYHTTFRVSPELVESYRSALDWGDTDPGRVPPAVFANFTPWYSALGGRPARGTVHLRQRMEHYAAASVGDLLDVRLRVADRYTRRDRRYVDLDIDFLGTRTLVCRAATTLVWGYTQ